MVDVLAVAERSRDRGPSGDGRASVGLDADVQVRDRPLDLGDEGAHFCDEGALVGVERRAQGQLGALGACEGLQVADRRRDVLLEHHWRENDLDVALGLDHVAHPTKLRGDRRLRDRDAELELHVLCADLRLDEPDVGLELLAVDLQVHWDRHINAGLFDLGLQHPTERRGEAGDIGLGLDLHLDALGRRLGLRGQFPTEARGIGLDGHLDLAELEVAHLYSGSGSSADASAASASRAASKNLVQSSSTASGSKAPGPVTLRCTPFLRR